MNPAQTWAFLQDAGNAQAQLLLVAIAHFADFETGEAWPTREKLARMAKCSVRTVVNYLNRLEADGLIEKQARTRDNGSQTSNLIVLVGYADWHQTLRDGGYVTKPKAVEKYSDEARANPAPPRADLAPPPCTVAAPPPCSLAAPPELPLNIKDTQNARARVREGGAHASRARLILRGDVHWSAWVAWTEHNMGSRASRLFQDAGGLVAFADKPHAGCQDPALPPGTGSARWAELMAERQSTTAVGDAA